MSAQRLPPETVVAIWEQGADRHPIDLALLLLRYGSADGAPDSEDWPIGRRDRRLIEIRRETFGDRIDGYIECPSCGNGLEFTLSCTGLVAEQRQGDQAPAAVEAQGVRWELREPTSRDLATVAGIMNLDQATQALLTRCLRNMDGGTIAAASVDEAHHSRLIAHLGGLDPLAEIMIDLNCRSCGHRWQSLFDIVAFFWNEIQAKARRLFQEIDLLARTYGWTERDFFALSERRRRCYVQMALS